MNPALFFFSSSFRNSSIFSSNFLPENSTGCACIFSFGLSGLLVPHTSSTRFSLIGFRADPPFFLILSESLRASATLCQRLQVQSCLVVLPTCCDKRWVNAYNLATFGLLRGPAALSVDTRWKSCPMHTIPAMLGRLGDPASTAPNYYPIVSRPG
jgi:hypothetical protein